MAEVVAEVAALRGLEAPRVEIELLSTADYAARVESTQSHLEWVKLLAPPDVARPIADYEYALARSVGHYDPARRSIVVLRDGDPRALEGTIAHEAQHALQHAHFPRARRGAPRDRQLAYEALREGDAELSEALFEAARSGVTRNRILYQLAAPDRTTDALLTDDDAAGSRFPYVAGAAFVASLYRAGGFAALHRAFDSPPESTEQILHPQRYLDDDPPVVVPPIPPLPGYTVVDEGTRGELGSWLWLRDCGDTYETLDRCEGCAAGWGGDRYQQLRGPAGDLHLWHTVWDSPAAARRFGDEATRCGVQAHRVGDRVLVAKGANPQTRRLGLAGMAKGRPHLRRAHPRGGAIPPLPPPVERTAAVVTDGFIRHAFVGLTGPLPRGFAEARRYDGVELALTAESARIFISLWERAPMPSERDRLARHVEESYADAAPKHVATESVSYPLGAGHRLTYRGTAPGWANLDLQLITVSICEDRGMLMFLLASFEMEPLAPWVARLRLEDGAPVCSLLHPPLGEGLAR